MVDSLAMLYPGFTSGEIIVQDDVRIAYTTGGSGPALLMLHGHPQTRAIWHKVAPDLARRHTLVMADLRGYGESSRPASTPEHARHAFRAMAQDQVQLMRALGHHRFDILAHDRGARTAHRLALDHPDAVGKMVLLDIAPTLHMYRHTREAFARAYWHWFFLIQPTPLPERLIEADPVAYIHDVMGGRSAGLAPFDPRAMAHYEHCIALPGTAHSICEDYRASAGIDLAHDEADDQAARKVTHPLLVLWGAKGAVSRCFDPMAAWQAQATDVRGEALPCGHYIPEEAPQALLDKAAPFLAPVSTP